jgi:hypothetical protein
MVPVQSPDVSTLQLPAAFAARLAVSGGAGICVLFLGGLRRWFFRKGVGSLCALPHSLVGGPCGSANQQNPSIQILIEKYNCIYHTLGTHAEFTRVQPSTQAQAPAFLFMCGMFVDNRQPTSPQGEEDKLL